MCADSDWMDSARTAPRYRSGAQGIEYGGLRTGWSVRPAAGECELRDGGLRTGWSARPAVMVAQDWIERDGGDSRHKLEIGRAHV